MKALSPLLREFRIRYYQHALKSLQRRDPTHADIPFIVRHLHELEAQRPRIEQPRRSRCADLPGMCAADAACPDLNCPGRWRGVHHTDGGMQVHGAIAFPIERDKPARLSVSS